MRRSILAGITAGPWDRSLHFFKEHPAWRAAIIAVNVGGIAFGFYYYADAGQFQATPLALWFFVPDSPMAVLWAEIALLAYALGRWRSDYVDALAFSANVQVGLWTAYVLTYYEESFGTWSLNLNFWLLWLHLGMVGLALLFVWDLRRSFASKPGRRWKVLGAVGAWVLLHDFIDYFAFDVYGSGCSIRPLTVPCTDAEGLLAAVTFGLSLLSLGALWLLTRRPPPVEGSGTGAPVPDAGVRARR